MGLQDFLYSVMIKKGIRTLVKVVISFLVSVKITSILQSHGITIDPTAMEAGLTASIASGIEMLRNYLKNKHGVKTI